MGQPAFRFLPGAVVKLARQLPDELRKQVAERSDVRKKAPGININEEILIRMFGKRVSR